MAIEMSFWTIIIASRGFLNHAESFALEILLFVVIRLECSLLPIMPYNLPFEWDLLRNIYLIILKIEQINAYFINFFSK